MHASPAHAPTDNASSLRGVLVPFAAVSAFLALIQVFCLGLSVAGVRIGRPVAALVLLVAVAVAAWFAARVRSDMARTFANEGRVASPGGLFERVLSGLVMVVLLWAAWVWFDLLRLAWHRPPYFWDSLVYHIPAINDWVQQGRVGFVRSVPDIPFANYPMGVEVTAFLVHQVTGTSRLVDASNLWYWPLGITALAVLAAEIGARGVWRWLAGALLFGAPTFVGQGATAYVDAGFSTTVMGSLAAACVFVSPVCRERWWSPLLLGLNVGLMVGSKGSGVLFAGVVLGLTFAADVWWRRAQGTRSLGWSLLACAGAALTVGGYWPVRNVLETGNAMYPYRLAFGRKVLGQGFDLVFLKGNTISSLADYPEWTWSLLAWLQPDAPIHGPGGATAGGLGYLWVAGAVPAILFLWLRKVRQTSRPSGAALTLLTALVCVLFLIQPAAWEARYVLWLHGLGLPCLATLLSTAVARWRADRRRLLTLTFGASIVALALWESSRTVSLEWSTGRKLSTPGSGIDFHTTLDVFFPGMADAAGFKDFLADATVARGRWSKTQHLGTLLGGALAMPLGSRRILVLPPLTAEELRDPYKAVTLRAPPTRSEIARARSAGARWFLWEADGTDGIPESLAPFQEHYVHRLTEDVSFALFWIGPGTAQGSQDDGKPTSR